MDHLTDFTEVVSEVQETLATTVIIANKATLCKTWHCGSGAHERWSSVHVSEHSQGHGNLISIP